MSLSPITVFIVESAAIARETLTDVLSSDPTISVIGTAGNGLIALEHIPQLQPDVVCTNLQMPEMNGQELIRQLLAISPRPVLVVSQTVKPTETQTINQVLQAGAIDVLPLPVTGQWSIGEKQALLEKIKVLAGVKVLTRPLVSSLKIISPPQGNQHRSQLQALAIGASTGGPRAIHQILSCLPSDFPLPIFCTQHISAGFLSGLISWQDTMCPLHVKAAVAGEVPIPGTVYFAPDHYHLTLDARGRCYHSKAPAVQRHCPSINVMFESLAQHYGAGVLGVLLTGMGQDGSVGLQQIAEAGGLTIAQDETSSVIFGMPKVAIDLGAADQVLPVDQIAPFILKYLNWPG